MQRKKILLGLIMLSLVVYGIEKKTAEKPKKPKKVTVETFEGQNTENWRAIANESRIGPEGGEETGQSMTDKVEISLNKDKKFVKDGKQSLKIVYTQSPESEKKFAMIAYTNSNVLMGDNDAISFWVLVDSGKANVSVQLIDKETATTRFYSKPILLDSKDFKTKKWKRIILKKADCANNAENKWECKGDITYGSADEKFWSNVSRPKFEIRGSVTLYVDDIEFVSAK